MTEKRCYASDKNKCVSIGESAANQVIDYRTDFVLHMVDPETLA